jgi:RimJ/RimL family protein N-acetyltransferase
LEVSIVVFEDNHQSDIDKMMATITEEFPEPISRPKVKGQLQQLPENYWVALVESKVIGTIALSPIENDSVVLKRMFLNKRFRGQGIALLLLNTAIKWSNTNKIDTIYLGTMTQFQAARRFYERNGFQQIARTDLPQGFPLNPVDSIFYRRYLK